MALVRGVLLAISVSEAPCSGAGSESSNKKLSTLAFIGSDVNIVLLGPSSVGKTHIAHALA
jgi:GTPase SAR1 family protein